jgi:hypothetical protein
VESLRSVVTPPRGPGQNQNGEQDVPMPAPPLYPGGNPSVPQNLSANRPGIFGGGAPELGRDLYLIYHLKF